MLTSWHDFLQNSGAHFDAGTVTHFGNPAEELQAAATRTILADLSHLGLIQLDGEDAQTFMQGQFTNDVRKLSATQSQLSGWCSPKGRLLANFLLWQNDGHYFLQLPAELQAPIQKRLTMFVLRSKVMLHDARESVVRFGIAGAQAEKLLAAQCGVLPSADFAVVNGDGAMLLRLPGGRFEIAATAGKAQALWQALTKDAQPVGTEPWQWLEVRAGIPVITPATQEQFVPQMANFDAINSVSFQKGCYPGQEIVARTQYLGKLKRRMYLAHVDMAAPPRAGDELYSADMEGQASGMVVNASPAPGGGYDLLAVAQISSMESSEIHIKGLDGPKLALLPQPYPLP